MVRPMSALLTGASSAKPVRKSGPPSAMKFQVSARLKEPCIPLSLLQARVGHLHRASNRLSAHPEWKERKLTAMAGMRRDRRARQRDVIQA